MLFAGAAICAGFAAESAPHGAKGKADAVDDKGVGTKSDSGGVNVGVPQAGSSGAGIKAGSATGAHDSAKGTDVSSVGRGTVTREPTDSRVHTGTSSDGISAGGVDTSATRNGATQAPHNETPIDLRITVQSPTKSKTTARVPDWTKTIRTSNNLRYHHPPGLRIDLERNAIGVLTPREFAPISVAGAEKNAASIALRNVPNVGRTDTVPLVSSSVPTVRIKTNAPTVNMATNPSILNGSGIGHPGGGTGTIGGGSKSVAGINGASFRGKQP